MTGSSDLQRSRRGVAADAMERRKNRAEHNKYNNDSSDLTTSTYKGQRYNREDELSGGSKSSFRFAAQKVIFLFTVLFLSYVCIKFPFTCWIFIMIGNL